MNEAVAGLLGIAAALPVSAAVGYFMGRSLTGPSAPTPTLYPCARCDEPDKVRGVAERCGPCEEVVTDIIFEYASRGVVLKDPLEDIRRNLRSKGL
ncbi:hypothetical protein [Streptomyces sp. NPDC002346]